MSFLPRRVSAVQRLESSAVSKGTRGPNLVRWLYPWKDINPIAIMMTPAQKKPSLNWVEVFHPCLEPMIDTTIPEMSEKRMAPIRMRRIVFFMALSIRSYSDWLRYGPNDFGLFPRCHRLVNQSEDHGNEPIFELRCVDMCHLPPPTLCLAAIIARSHLAVIVKTWGLELIEKDRFAGDPILRREYQGRTTFVVETRSPRPYASIVGMSSREASPSFKA
jgi:hypothetical protein